MLWKKPAGVHYTELCMFIDENVPLILEPGKYPQLEDKIYNYLWLVVKALAIKKRMFTNFSDYDPFSFYAANRLFFALRKNLINQGKVIKGKEIRPIKSCLNYMKTLLYPMKVEYQNENYKIVISEEFVAKKFDAFKYEEQLKNEVRYSKEVVDQFHKYVTETFSRIDMVIDKVLKKSPFTSNTLDYKKIKISILLNSLHSLRTKKKLEVDNGAIILWKLPKTMTSYVRLLLNEFYSEIKLQIMECYEVVAVDDNMIEKIISGQDGQNYEYDE